MQKFLYFLLISGLLTACASNNKRIIIMSKGAAQFDEATKTISAKDGNGHDQKIINLSGPEIALKLNGPTGEASISLKENGLYILNIKNDTIIGSKQNYIVPKSSKDIMTQDELKIKLDSLHQLILGKNVSAANHNFFILPNQAVKVTDNLEAIIVGPYHKMTTAESVDGKAPEVYRFFSIHEVKATIARLEGFTKPSIAVE
ncbi:MAG: YgdI/YgdR family lipoprotein [Chitinophagaceae bacterium]|nr:YgdI/YgdR family lipoprotein [Chitinophagaceae bacterium]